MASVVARPSSFSSVAFPIGERIATSRPVSQPLGETTSYPHLRSVLTPEYALLPTEYLEALMEYHYGENAAEQIDESLGSWLKGAVRDVGHAVSTAAPVVANVAGGVVRGAMAGSSMGLPGIIGGAITGGAGTALSSYGGKTLRGVGQGLNMVTNTVGQFTPMGRLGGALGGGLSGLGKGQNVLKTVLGTAGQVAGSFIPGGAGGAAGALSSLLGGAGGAGGALSSMLGGVSGGGGAGATLLNFLQRPEMQQAIGALGMGALGRQSIPVGAAQTPIPTNALVNLLGVLANRAADEQMELSEGRESDLRYLQDDAGEWVVDPAESDERAGYLMQLLDAAENERQANAAWQEQVATRQMARQQKQARQMRAAEMEMENESAMYDAIDLADMEMLTGGYSDNIGEMYDEWDENDEWDEYDEWEA